ncbi:hypothetical protein RZS08_56915, partial [Arthrospira platensis SPKY1]|nr:hypothetical protein [Arthrospira platensis SPKY1]
GSAQAKFVWDESSKAFEQGNYLEGIGKSLLGSQLSMVSGVKNLSYTMGEFAAGLFTNPDKNTVENIYGKEGVVKYEQGKSYAKALSNLEASVMYPEVQSTYKALKGLPTPSNSLEAFYHKGIISRARTALEKVEAVKNADTEFRMGNLINEWFGKTLLNIYSENGENKVELLGNTQR